MIRLELLAFGRCLRLRLSWSWRWWVACCAGTLVVEAGPLSLSLSTRRQWGWK
jgi:hypothetical protein